MALTYVAYNVGTSDASASTLATSATQSVANGNLLVAFVCSTYDSSNNVSSVTDGASNGFTYVTRKSVAGACIELWVKLASTYNTTATFTATWAGNVQYRRIMVLQYSGAKLGGTYYDTSGSLNTGTGTTIAPSNITTTLADDLLLVGTYALGAVTHTAGSSFSKRSSGTVREACFERIVSATGTYPSGTVDTLGSSQTYVSILYAFKANEYATGVDSVYFTPYKAHPYRVYRASAPTGGCPIIGGSIVRGMNNGS